MKPREDRTSPSINFIIWLYVIYALLHLLVFLFDYFLWKIKFQVHSALPYMVYTFVDYYLYT